MKAVIFFLFFICTIPLLSQEIIQGRVLDLETNEPMPFTFLVKKRTSTGAVTNEDGFFSLACLPTDTLLVRFIGYETRKLPVSYFLKESVLYLKPKVNQLNTVTVFGDADLEPYLAMFNTARKKLLAAEPYDSKAYFVLESSYKSNPVELLECYYNAELAGHGIKNLALKNGRIGISEIDNSYFVSLHTTKMLEAFNLLFKNNLAFPFNPLHYPIFRIKQLYHIKLISLTQDAFALEFIFKEDYGNLFSAKIWVDKKLENFLKVELWTDNLIKYPFNEIDEQHTMDSLSFRIAYSYDNSVRQTLNKIAFNYGFDYDNNVNKRRIQTKGILLFYEKDSQFDLPFNAFVDNTLSDYDKIVSQPYNPLFWKYNEVLAPSKKVLEAKAFFKTNGVLLNFSKLAPLNPFFKTNIIPWNSRRLRQSIINGEQNFQLSVKKLSDKGEVYRKSSFYEFVCAIYLDRNTINDSTFYNARTLISLDKSYYYLKANKFTDCLINIVFDLVEIENRKMTETLNSNSWSMAQVDSIYNAANRAAKLNVSEFTKVTAYGRNEPRMMEYITAIDSILGVENYKIIRTTTSEYEDSIINYYITEIDNIGKALLNLGKYKVALNVFKVGEGYGDDYPWLYYNMGLCYYNLGRKDLACKNFKRAKKKGASVDSVFVEHCD